MENTRVWVRFDDDHSYSGPGPLCITVTQCSVTMARSVDYAREDLAKSEKFDREYYGQLESESWG